MKGYPVYIPCDKAVVVTQHLKDVETLTKAQNDQFRRARLAEPEENLCNVPSQEKWVDSRRSRLTREVVYGREKRM